MSPQEVFGRDLESAAIDRMLGALPDHSSVACFAGEPGIGKTTLLDMLRSRAESQGVLVLAGSGAEFERSVPFGVAVEALNERLAGLGPNVLNNMSTDDLARLAPAFPALGGLGDSPDEISEDRSRVLGAIRNLIELVADGQPLVLVIDDLHWADGGSLELISHLIRRPPRAAVLLVLAYRPQLLAERAGTARAAFIAGAADVVVEPGPLSRDASAALVGDRLPGDRFEAVLTESGGNPFYLEQLTADGGVMKSATGSGLAGVPRVVAGSLAGEFDRLSTTESVVCRAAAVVGYRFEPDLVAAAAEIPEATALDAIDGLIRIGIARGTDVPRRFRFRHPIVCRAAYEGVEPGYRLAAHRRVAEALEARGATSAELAHHVENSARPGDIGAVELLISAGRATERTTPSIAARWYEAALRLLPGDDQTGRISLLVALATAEGSAGHLEKSRETLEEVVDVLPPELEPLRLRILPFLALVGHMLGRHGESTAMLRRTLTELGGVETVESAQLGIAAAIDCLYEPDFETMLGFASTAERTARATVDPALEAASSGVLALALYYSGILGESRESCTRAVEQMTVLEDRELAAQLEGVFSVVWTSMSLEMWDECIGMADRGLAISRATGQEQLIVPLSIARTVARTWCGELAEAADDADHLIDSTRLSGIDQWIAWTLTLRGWIAGQIGDVELAVECGEEACRIAKFQTHDGYFVAHARLHLAETRLEQGRPEDCCTEILSAAGGPELPVCERPIRSRWYEILTRASLAMGEADVARSWAERAAEAVRGSSIGGRLSEAAMAAAQVELAAGRPELAERRALKAVTAASQGGDRLLAARARVIAARARSGERRREAIEGIREAQQEFVECGATRLRDEAVRELRRLGHRVGRGGSRGRGEAGVEALSRRESEVAHLVTEGLTNREIAERLVLSEKTIETHLSAVFRKLGVRRRAAVGPILWREGS